MKIRGKYVAIDFQNTKYNAFIPEKLPFREKLEIDNELLRAVASAYESIGRVEGRKNSLPDFEVIASMYVKREAVLSSQIEGTEASLKDILSKEKEIQAGKATDDEKVTYNYVKAVNYGLERMKKTGMTLDLVKDLHRILLKGTRGENKEPGALRKRQNLIVNSMNQITFVPPPVRHVENLMKNLVDYINDEKEKSSDILKCSLMHYQFETIHPFLDGNGRIGRLLINLFLVDKQVLSSPMLYMSIYLLKNRSAYYNALGRARKDGDFKGWIMFFMKGVEETGKDVYELSGKIISLKKRTIKKAFDRMERTSAGMDAAIADLFRYPITSVNRISESTGLSYNASKTIIEKLVSQKILSPYDERERDRKFVFGEYLKLLE